MAKHRGRPSRTVLRQTRKRDSTKIADEFRRHPLRQPVDPLFETYYQCMLKGDLAAVTDYCESNSGRFSFDASFYELIGRLVTRQDLAAAKQIVSEISRRHVHSRRVRGGRIHAWRRIPSARRRHRRKSRGWKAVA